MAKKKSDKPVEYILSLSYGKDSLACLGAIEELGWTLDRIVHAEVWATDTIPADLPQMVAFKHRADAIIKDRWGIEVEHVRSIYSYRVGGKDVFNVHLCKHVLQLYHKGRFSLPDK